MMRPTAALAALPLFFFLGPRLAAAQETTWITAIVYGHTVSWETVYGAPSSAIVTPSTTSVPASLTSSFVASTSTTLPTSSVIVTSVSSVPSTTPLLPSTTSTTTSTTSSSPSAVVVVTSSSTLSTTSSSISTTPTSSAVVVYTSSSIPSSTTSTPVVVAPTTSSTSASPVLTTPTTSSTSATPLVTTPTTSSTSSTPIAIALTTSSTPTTPTTSSSSAIILPATTSTLSTTSSTPTLLPATTVHSTNHHALALGLGISLPLLFLLIGLILFLLLRRRNHHRELSAHFAFLDRHSHEHGHTADDISSENGPVPHAPVTAAAMQEKGTILPSNRRLRGGEKGGSWSRSGRDERDMGGKGFYQPDREPTLPVLEPALPVLPPVALDHEEKAWDMDLTRPGTSASTASVGVPMTASAVPVGPGAGFASRNTSGNGAIQAQNPFMTPAERTPTATTASGSVLGTTPPRQTQPQYLAAPEPAELPTSRSSTDAYPTIAENMAAAAAAVRPWQPFPPTATTARRAVPQGTATTSYVYPSEDDRQRFDFGVGGANAGAAQGPTTSIQAGRWDGAVSADQQHTGREPSLSLSKTQSGFSVPRRPVAGSP